MDLGYIVKLKEETDEEDKTIYIYSCKLCIKTIGNLKLNLEISFIGEI